MMLPKFMSPFKVECQEGNKQMNKRRNPSPPADGGGHAMSSIDESATMEVGLRLLIQVSSSSNSSKSNVVVKSAVRKAKTKQTSPVVDFNCFLKTCNLCNKQLSPGKDIYMYRGDQGFCSIECRNRQIVADEMRELESSTKKMVASYGHCCSDARRETRLILEDLRMQRLKSKPIRL